MPNLRIVSDNAMARAASLTANVTSGTLLASNLLLDVKSLVHRSTTTSVTYTATWTSLETLACVALPFCNYTAAATMRVRLYSDTAGTTLIYDSTALPACPAPAVALRGFTATAALSAYAYGGGACARMWFAPLAARRLVIDIADGGNPQGYVEASRLIAGNYWSPAYQADVGAQLTFMDTSRHVRTDAGDLLTGIGPRQRKVSLNFSFMPVADRKAAINLLRGSGMGNPLFLSVFPADADLELERDYQLYGKLTAISSLTLTTMNTYSLPLDLEEI